MLAGLAFVLFLTVPPTQADEWNLETKITPDHQIEVPGAVLEANTTYIIALMDSPYERKVVRVYNGDRSHVLTQFIAISAENNRFLSTIWRRIPSLVSLNNDKIIYSPTLPLLNLS
jgi:hypothetical protein